jgi:predicted transcriptional regulator
MTLAPNLPLAEVTSIALRLLIHEMGVVNTARFLNQYATGLGDSVVEKATIMGTLTVADIAAAIRQEMPPPRHADRPPSR